MDGFYAFGGGMGHLSRVKKFISHQNITEFKVFTGNPVASRFFDQENVVLFHQKGSNLKASLEEYLKQNLAKFHFDNFYVDCFPAGILYELKEEFIQSKKNHYLTRAVKQNSYYFDRVTVKYNSCIALEGLSNDQLKFAKHQNIIINYIQLPSPIPDISLISDSFSSIGQNPRWLIVHSSNKDEIELLIMKANQLAELETAKPQLFLISDNISRIGGVNWIKNEMKPINYFPLASKIFSGAGFNMIHELQGFEEKVICLPFERKYDDQTKRWNMSKSGG